MSELALFLFGCFVTLIVGAAIAFLYWGVSNEPAAGEAYDDETLVRPFDTERQLEPHGLKRLEGGLAPVGAAERNGQARRVSDR